MITAALLARREPGLFIIDAGTLEVLDLNMNAGDDTLTTDSGLGAFKIDAEGGDGNDILDGGDGADSQNFAEEGPAETGVMERETDDAPPRPEVGGEDDRSCSIIRNHRHRAAGERADGGERAQLEARNLEAAMVAVTLGNGRSLVQLASMIDSAMTTGRKRPGFAGILTVATHSHQRTARSSLGTVRHQLRPPSKYYPRRHEPHQHGHDGAERWHASRPAPSHRWVDVATAPNTQAALGLR
jgi:hypothetical protein